LEPIRVVSSYEGFGEFKTENSGTSPKNDAPEEILDRET